MTRCFLELVDWCLLCPLCNHLPCVSTLGGCLCLFVISACMRACVCVCVLDWRVHVVLSAFR